MSHCKQGSVSQREQASFCQQCYTTCCFHHRVVAALLPAFRTGYLMSSFSLDSFDNQLLLALRNENKPQIQYSYKKKKKYLDPPVTLKNLIVHNMRGCNWCSSLTFHINPSDDFIASLPLHQKHFQFCLSIVTFWKVCLFLDKVFNHVCIILFQWSFSSGRLATRPCSNTKRSRTLICLGPGYHQIRLI